MNAAQATLYGALIGALIAGIFTLLGVVAGLLDQAWLRRRGEETVPHLGVKGHLETQEVNYLGFCHMCGVGRGQGGTGQDRGDRAALEGSQGKGEQSKLIPPLS
jgi:hypothetical protein